jgi:hypothetical protein
MVLEQEIPSYSVWFPQALKHFGETAFFVILGALVVSYLVAAFRYGPLAAGDRLYRALLGAAKDLVSIAPRRVWALARLSIHEAIRRRVWVALVAFAVVLMFAGWFLDPNSPEPGPLYLRFVMSATTYLVLLMALLISTFSLPADVKNRTITTVVTKPVHTSEIVLGRIVGFTVVGTVLLTLMALASYVFVARALNHTHEIVFDDEAAAELGHLKPGRVGNTRMAQNHQHDVLLREDGVLETDFKFGHKHYIRTEKVGGKTRYICESPEDLLTARVPLLGKLRFLDRDGQPKEKGINVGHEWDYRGFVDGNTKSEAIFTFDNIDEDKLFPNIPAEDRKLPLEMNIRVFRTYKGDIENGIRAKLFLRNPETHLDSQPFIFRVKEFTIESRFVPRRLDRAKASEGDPKIDLFKDLVHDGKLEVHLQCLESGQLLGVAAPDLYIRADDASFPLSFLKGYLGIWMQMELVIGIGVMFSTFLSGAVAMVATLGCMVIGFFAEEVGKLFEAVITGNSKIMPGGGPVESFVRLITQKSITAPYDESPSVDIMKWVDSVFMRVLKGWTDVLPDFSGFWNVKFVVGGFNVPTDLVLEQLTQMAAYMLAAFIAGFLFLRMREVAR